MFETLPRELALHRRPRRERHVPPPPSPSPDACTPALSLLLSVLLWRALLSGASLSVAVSQRRGWAVAPFCPPPPSAPSLTARRGTLEARVAQVGRQGPGSGARGRVLPPPFPYLQPSLLPSPSLPLPLDFARSLAPTTHHHHTDTPPPPPPHTHTHTLPPQGTGDGWTSVVCMCGVCVCMW